MIVAYHATKYGWLQMVYNHLFLGLEYTSKDLRKSLSGLVVHRQSMELLSSLPVRLDDILEFTKLQY